MADNGMIVSTVDEYERDVGSVVLWAVGPRLEVDVEQKGLFCHGGGNGVVVVNKVEVVVELELHELVVSSCGGRRLLTGIKGCLTVWIE